VIRIYWHQGPARLTQELGRLGGGRGSTWRLPLTATEEERLLAAAEAPLPERQGMIVLWSWRQEMADWLADVCRGCGYATVRLDPQQPIEARGAAAAIYDAAERRDPQLALLRRLSSAVAPAPVAAILDFPRLEDRRRAENAGAAVVLSKPLGIADLAWHLDQLTSACTRNGS
jgi:hypothetical protein